MTPPPTPSDQPSPSRRLTARSAADISSRLTAAAEVLAYLAG
jgi:hypothetical protein